MQNTAKAYEQLQAGNFSKAKQLLLKNCKINKSDSESLAMLGYIYSQLSEHNKAIQCLLKVTQLNPTQPVVFYNLGNAYKAKGDYVQATKAYKKSIKIKPGINACMNLGNTLETLKYYDEAIVTLELAISLSPKNGNAYYNLARVLKSSGLLEDSAAAYEKSIELNANFLPAYNNLANTYLSLGEIEKADIFYNKALRLDPQSLDVLSGKIRLLDKTKKFDQALELIQPYLNKQENHAGLCATFADFSHYLGLEEQAISWLVKTSNCGSISKADKSRLCFLLGKLYDNKCEYELAFKNYDMANSLIHSVQNLAQNKKYFSMIKSTFSQEKLKQYNASTEINKRPLFIVGMPRSGTSLVEQIIASHPDAMGAGELEAISSLIKDSANFNANNKAYPKVVSHLSTDQFNVLARKYLQRIDRLDSSAKYVTDKMPHNFLHLGFIQLLFPNCKIIHCRRSPLDTSLSCYFQDFSGNHPYSTDLNNLAEYYKLYNDLMEFWQDNLSLPIFTIDYEDLVSNQLETSKRLIDFCELGWHDNCENFYDSKRLVSTASYDQVRQKVYSKSVNRWKNYESFIQPLVSALSRI